MKKEGFNQYYDVDFDPIKISTSKWQSGPHICERFSGSWQKNDPKWSKNGHLWAVNFQYFFFQNWKKMRTEIFLFYLLAFDPIEFQMRLAPQNDHHQLSFVKDIYPFGEKITINIYKIAKLKGCLFWTDSDYISHNCWSAPPVDSQEENPLTFKLVNTTSGKLRVALTLKCLPVHLLLQKVGYNDHGGFHVVAKIIRELKSHIQVLHWLKLQHSDWRAIFHQWEHLNL